MSFGWLFSREKMPCAEARPQTSVASFILDAMLIACTPTVDKQFRDLASDSVRWTVLEHMNTHSQTYEDAYPGQSAKLDELLAAHVRDAPALPNFRRLDPVAAHRPRSPT